MTTPPWQLDFTAAPRVVGRELFVGEWRCAAVAPHVSRDVTRYLELGLQLAGTHLRSVGRERRLIDVTVVTRNAAGDEVTSASRGPQRTTTILVRGDLADALRPRLTTRFAALTNRAAHHHAALLAAPDAFAAEEHAHALVAALGGPDPAPARAVTAAHRVLADDARHVIATRFADRLTVEGVAAACGVSAFHLCRVFRAATGTTLHRHLNRVRVVTALYQLSAARGRLAELALAVGFSSHSHFTQAFRAELGRAPSAT